ncbi:MAG: hypothetical protein ABSH39_01360, partial [Candidatus Acidiferrum sp.]
GPHGSPTSDSERTMVTAATKRVLAILISFGGAQGLMAFAERMAGLLREHGSGKNLAITMVECS